MLLTSKGVLKKGSAEMCPDFKTIKLPSSRRELCIEIVFWLPLEGQRQNNSLFCFFLNALLTLMNITTEPTVINPLAA